MRHGNIPILCALERTDDEGNRLHLHSDGIGTALEEPLEIDASQLSIKDPERDLKTIAKEWAADKKANPERE